MDFGFDGFLNKFEEHFGKGWTKFLLILIGLAVSSLCLGAIWRYLFSPILGFFEVPGRLEMIARIVVTGAAITSGLLIAVRTYDWLLRKSAERLGPSETLRIRIEATERILEALKRKAEKQQKP